MRRPRRKGLRVPPLFVLFVVALAVAALFVVDAMIDRAAEGPMHTVSPSPDEEAEAIERQEGQYRGLQPSLRPLPPATGTPDTPVDPEATGGTLGGGGRSLATVGERRAYPGAPPFIPHPVVAEMATGDVCLTCHRFGGWAPRFAAWTPPTPHPDLASCQQCHVARTVETEFRSTAWRRPEAPPVGGAALPGSTPPVPPTLQMRGDCLACHAGPAAPKEIRTTHPERVGCLQCHVPTAGGIGSGGWVRGASFEGGEPETEEPR